MSLLGRFENQTIEEKPRPKTFDVKRTLQAQEMREAYMKNQNIAKEELMNSRSFSPLSFLHIASLDENKDIAEKFDQYNRKLYQSGINLYSLNPYGEDRKEAKTNSWKKAAEFLEDSFLDDVETYLDDKSSEILGDPDIAIPTRIRAARSWTETSEIISEIQTPNE